MAKKIVENISLEYIDIAEAIRYKLFKKVIFYSKFRKNKFYTEYDEQLDTYVLDEDKLLDFLEVFLSTNYSE